MYLTKIIGKIYKFLIIYAWVQTGQPLTAVKHLTFVGCNPANINLLGFSLVIYEKWVIIINFRSLTTVFNK